MSLRKDLIKHQMSVQRLTNTQTLVIKDFLNQLKEEAKRQIVFGSKGKVLRDSLRSSVSELANTALDNLSDIAVYESEFTVRITNKYSTDKITNINPEQIDRRLRNTSAGIGQLEETRGKSLNAMYSQFANRKSDDIARVISDGRLRGLAFSEIGKLVVERIDGLHSSQAKVLSNTSINYAVSVGREETLKDNNVDMIWISVLDDSTCDYCEGNHERSIQEIGDTPPAHWGCKCYVEPVTD